MTEKKKPAKKIPPPPEKPRKMVTPLPKMKDRKNFPK